LTFNNMNPEFIPTISSDGYLTSVANFAPYKISIWESLSNFGKVGSSIKTGIKFIATKPTPQQFEADGTTHTFEQEHTIAADNTSPLRISADGKRQLRDAISKFERISERMEVDNSYCFSFLLKSLSPDIKIALSSAPGYDAAFNSSDSFDFWAIIESNQSKSGSRVIRSRCINLFQLQQGSDLFETFIDKVRQGETHLTQDFGSTSVAHKGFIKISHLVSLIFLGGVDQQFFSFPLERCYETFKDGKIDDQWQEVAKFQDYRTQHSLSAETFPKPFSEVSSAFVAPSQVQPSLKPKGGQPLCSTCMKPFTPGVGAGGNPHRKCKDCFDAERPSRKAPRADRPDKSSDKAEAKKPVQRRSQLCPRREQW